MDDAVRKRFKTFMDLAKVDMQSASLAIGRGKTYARDAMKRERGKLEDIEKIVEAIDPAFVDWVTRARGDAPTSETIRPRLGELATESPRDAQERGNDLVKVGGRIGAGAEILPEFDQREEQYAEVHFPLPKNSMAFEVVGDSMWPRYDPGDLVICQGQVATRGAADGIEAAVQTEDGRRYLKTVRRVGEDAFDLESYNARPIRNVRLEWVAKVIIVAKAGEWRWVEPKPKK